MNRMIQELMLTGKNQVELWHTVKKGTLSPESVWVRNFYSLISPGTELALFTGTHIGFKDPETTWARYPLPPGYASVGEIERIGQNVKGFSIGERVLHYQPHADQSIVDTHTDLLFPIPADMDIRHALFARFGQIAYTAVAASQQTEGKVLVFGGGIVGNLCAQLFMQRKQREVILADLSASRVELARKCGIDHCMLTEKKDLKPALEEITKGTGVSTVIEATGVPELVCRSLELVNRLGEVILLGSTRGTVNLDVYKHIHRKAVALIGAHEGRYPRFGGSPSENSQESFSNDVLKMIDEGVVAVDPFITDTVKPEKVAEAYRLLLDDGDHHLGILIRWN